MTCSRGVARQVCGRQQQLEDATHKLRVNVVHPEALQPSQKGLDQLIRYQHVQETGNETRRRHQGGRIDSRRSKEGGSSNSLGTQTKH